MSVECLEQLSVQTELPLSLKRHLHCLSKDELLNEFDRVHRIYQEDNVKFSILEQSSLSYRLKSRDSAYAKYQKYMQLNPSARIEQVFNDILGLETLCSSYTLFQRINWSNIASFHCADMSLGKKNDDGYRGIHLYYQTNHHFFPIELQYHTLQDKQMNQWLHIYVYKQGYDISVGRKIREFYDKNGICDIMQFKEVLKHVLLDC